MKVGVTCFAQNATRECGDAPLGFEVVRPIVRRGCRWDLPGRSLAWQAVRSIRRHRPDLVISVGVTRLARYLLRGDVAAKLVVWELTQASPGNKFVDGAASRKLGRCRGMLSPSKTIDENIRATYGYPGKIVRLPFWIEDEQLPAVPALAKYEADFIFLGRRDVDKGLSELLQATAIVARRFPQLRVLVAGPGDDAPFAALARDLGVAPHVSFRFFPKRADAMTALGQSRFLLLPSHHEGYPLVLLEAAQRSVPFIATRVGSIPEVYGGSRAALLVPSKDKDALASAMIIAMSEAPEDYGSRRLAAHSLFRGLASAHAVRSRLDEAMKSLMAKPLGDTLATKPG